MSQATSIKRNSLFSFFSILFRLVANFVVFWVLARHYGPEIFGQFTFSHTLATSFLFLADFGFDVLLTTELAKDKSRSSQIFQQLFSLKLVFTGIAVVGMWLFAFLFNLSDTSRILVLVLSLYLVFSTLTNFLNALFKGFEKLELEAKVSFFSNMGLMVFAIILIILKASVILIAISFFVSRAIGLIVGFKYSLKLLDDIKFKLNFSDFKKIRGKVFVFGIHFLFNYLYFQIDTIILAVMKGDYYVGIYQAVFKLIALALVLPEILNNALLPVLSRLNVENIIHWKKAGYLMNKVLLIIGLPISIVLFVYAEQIIPFVYGPKNYVEAIPVLRVFSVVLIIRLILESYSLMLTTSERQKVRMYVVLGATIINVVLNILFVPKFGVLAVALVSILTNGLVLFVYSIANYSLFKEWTINRNTGYILFLTVIIFGALWFMREINFILSGILVLMIFSFTSIKFFFSQEEKNFLYRGNMKFQFSRTKN